MQLVYMSIEERTTKMLQQISGTLINWMADKDVAMKKKELDREERREKQVCVRSKKKPQPEEQQHQHRSNA